jgi:hypothetical protein
MKEYLLNLVTMNQVNNWCLVTRNDVIVYDVMRMPVSLMVFNIW